MLFLHIPTCFLHSIQVSTPKSAPDCYLNISSPYLEALCSVFTWVLRELDLFLSGQPAALRYRLQPGSFCVLGLRTEPASILADGQGHSWRDRRILQCCFPSAHV